MDILQQIAKKKTQFKKVKEKYNDEIKELQWKFINEKYDLQENCVCNVQGLFYLLTDIKTFYSERSCTIELSLCRIFRDGKISRSKQYFKLDGVKKECNNTKEFFNSVDGYQDAAEEIK